MLRVWGRFTSPKYIKTVHTELNIHLFWQQTPGPVACQFLWCLVGTQIQRSSVGSWPLGLHCLISNQLEAGGHLNLDMNKNQKFSSLAELATFHTGHFSFVVWWWNPRLHTCCTDALHRNTLPALRYHLLASVVTYAQKDHISRHK